MERDLQAPYTHSTHTFTHGLFFPRSRSRNTCEVGGGEEKVEIGFFFPILVNNQTGRTPSLQLAVILEKKCNEANTDYTRHQDNHSQAIYAVSSNRFHRGRSPVIPVQKKLDHHSFI